MKTSEYLRRALGVAVLAGAALVVSGGTAGAQTNCPTTTTTPTTSGATTSTTQSQSQSPATTASQSPAVAENAVGGFALIAQTSCPGSNVLATTGLSLGAVAALGGGATALALASRRVARRSA